MTFHSRMYPLGSALPSTGPTRKVWPFLAIVALPLFAHGAILLNEPFAYTNGPLVVVSAGAWTTHSGVSNQMEVASGRADLSAPESEDVNALLAGQPYP